jgi:hypothetical protein
MFLVHSFSRRMIRPRTRLAPSSAIASNVSLLDVLTLLLSVFTYKRERNTAVAARSLSHDFRLRYIPYLRYTVFNANPNSHITGAIAHDLAYGPIFAIWNARTAYSNTLPHAEDSNTNSITTATTCRRLGHAVHNMRMSLYFSENAVHRSRHIQA